MGGEIDLAIEGLSDYQLIGSGGFAIVYSAYEQGLHRQVAVKVLAAVDASGRRRFDRERLSMGRTADHPNIVTPLRSGYTGPPDARPYLVMEYLPGGSLQDRLNTQGPMPWVEAVAALVPIADALAYSHDLGVIHRDIKPGNILVSRTGTAKLTDFGIASVLGATATTQVAFSLAYAAPETFEYDPAPLPGRSPDRRDNRSDIYSLGATLYALGIGRPPYESESWGGLMSQIVAAPVPRVGIEPLDRFFARAMAKDPWHRPQSTGEVLGHLRELLDQLGGEPSPTPRKSNAPTERAPDHDAPVARHPAPPRAEPQPIAQPTPSVLDTGVAVESELRRRNAGRRWQPIVGEDTGGGRQQPGGATGPPADPGPEARPDLRLALLAVAVLVMAVALVAAIRLLAA
ncbi:MAG: protein kinase [Acidimicrobiales bacterium]